MPLIEYVSKKFRAKALEIIRIANAILDEYEALGLDLTLRQLYYQFVSRDIIANNDREYTNLGTIVNDARLAGLIDWDRIVDRTRFQRSSPHWTNPADIIKTCTEQYRLDKWADQPCRVAVWIEKDALIGVIEKVCTELDVPYFSCRGYVSQSEMWQAAGRIIVNDSEHDQPTFIIHLGDHDPSGIDMSRDIQDRLNLFGANVAVERIALTMSQVAEYEPPPNPAKITDSRSNGYISEYGNESWELDALEPTVITDLIKERVLGHMDFAKFKAAKEKELEHRKLLEGVSKHWEVVEGVVKRNER